MASDRERIKAALGVAELTPESWASAAFDCLDPDNELCESWLAEQLTEYRDAMKAAILKLIRETREECAKEICPLCRECQPLGPPTDVWPEPYHVHSIGGAWNGDCRAATIRALNEEDKHEAAV